MLYSFQHYFSLTLYRDGQCTYPCIYSPIQQSFQAPYPILKPQSNRDAGFVPGIIDPGQIVFGPCCRRVCRCLCGLVPGLSVQMSCRSVFFRDYTGWSVLVRSSTLAVRDSPRSSVWVPFC